MNQRTDRYQCEIVQDLLPLYRDEICSPGSRKIVEEHVEGCPVCSAVLEKLRNTCLEDRLAEEKRGVLEAHYKQERRRTLTIGACVAGILMIPVIVCLICNLAIGHALDWFFIVLASLLLLASLSVVPLVAPARTAGLMTIACFTGSLLLLLGVICLYARGNWFFLAAVPTVFGLSVFLMPYVVYRIPLPKPLCTQKGLLVMLWDTCWLYGVIVVCGLYSRAPGYWRIALEITGFCVLLPWAVFLVVRYLKIHGLAKAGICCMVTGLFCMVVNDVIQLILGSGDYTWSLSDVDFSCWSYPFGQANTFVLIFATLWMAGMVLFGIGTARGKKRPGSPQGHEQSKPL